MTQDLLNRPDASNSRPYPMAKGAGHLRVMTYNVRIDHVDDRDNHHCWTERKALVSAVIAGYDVDVVAVQEADGQQADELHRLLPGYAFEGFPTGLGHAGEERLLFYYDSERLELQEKAVFSLSPTPDRPAKAWDARYPRSVVYGKFRDKHSGKTIALFNTHFDHVGQQARVESVKVLLKVQKALAGATPQVVLGDFNLFPEAGGEGVYRAFLEAATGLRDVRDVAGQELYGPDGTWIGWEHETSCASDGTAGHRLDHIFVGGSLQVVRAGVLPASADADGRLVADYLNAKDPMRRYPSDHLPVVADITL